MTDPQAPDPADLARRLGVDMDLNLLGLALTHRSFAYENGGLSTNERLEFLGDSVLGLVVTDTLYRKNPDRSEGDLARIRAAVVNSRALAEVGRALGLGDHLRLGRGEDATGGRDKASILADVTEAVLGAVYIDRGLEVASGVIHRLFDPLIAVAEELGAALDWKTSLQEIAAQVECGVPDYVVSDSGPDHEKTFNAKVFFGKVEYGSGSGSTKKEAEQVAAAAAYRRLAPHA